MKSRSNAVNVKVQLLRTTAKAPTFAKEGDACADVYFCRPADGPLMVRPGDSALLATGIAIELPDGWEAVVRGRSGLGCRGVAYHIGTIDSGYRGEIAVYVRNESAHLLEFRGGDRIAQLAVRRVPVVTFEVVNELSESARGATGFGSSGR